MLLGLYRAATRVGGPLITAHLRRRARLGKEDPQRLGERLGRAGLARPEGRLVWLHAASVGESQAVLPLIEALLSGRPALELLLTTGTPTSAQVMAQRLPTRARHQFAPVDRPAAWRAFFTHWRPDLGLLVESELWPNLILEARAGGVPLALINARLSPRSHGRWRRAPRTARELLESFEICLAQSEADRGRLADLGATPAVALGNLKHTAAPLPAAPDQLAALRAAFGSRPVWLAASTHPGEEELVLDLHRRLAKDLPDVVTVIAPRHPERGDAIADLIERAGLTFARRSQGRLPAPTDAVHLVDTIGELGLFYRLARVAFIGKSLAVGGGQNPLEAALLGCPPLLGPLADNVAEISSALEAKGGLLRVADALDLARHVARLLSDPAAREALATRARAAASEGQPLDATLDRLAPLLERTLGPADAGA